MHRPTPGACITDTANNLPIRDSLGDAVLYGDITLAAIGVADSAFVVQTIKLGV